MKKKLTNTVSTGLFNIAVRTFLLGFIFSGLTACGGGTAGEQNQIQQVSSHYIAVAQKGPFKKGSVVLISQLNPKGKLTGNTIRTKVTDNKGSFKFDVPKSWNVREGGYALEIKTEGFFLNELSGKPSINKINLLSITNNPDSSSVNVLTHIAAHRAKTLIKKGKPLSQALQQANKEISAVFGINNIHQLDISQFNFRSLDSASLLLLSGALLEVAQSQNINPQRMISEIADDLAVDGKLTDLGNDWLKRMQAVVRSNPSIKVDRYANRLFDQKLTPPTGKHLSKVVKLASRPTAILPKEIIAEPGDTIILDGSTSHGNGNSRIVNSTWFRVDQQKEFNLQVSDRFSASPSLALPNIESEFLFAMIVTDINKLTDTAVVKIIVKKPPPENNKPVAFDQSVVTDEDVDLNIVLEATDLDGDPLAYLINTPLLLNKGILEGTPPNLVYKPDDNAFGKDEFIFTVTDSLSTSNTATVDITINPVNDPPVAKFSAPSSVQIGEQIDLDGSASFDIDGTIVDYVWTSSTGENLSGATTHFLAPTTTSSVTVELTVEDNEGAKNSESVVISVVAPPNIPPVANAGTDQIIVLTGSTHTVNLDGSTSKDPDGLSNGTDLIYKWTTVSSPASVSFNDDSSPTPSFDVSTIGTYILELKVTDTDGASHADEISIVIQATPNNLPVATPLNYKLNQDSSPVTVALAGTDSDGDTVTVVDSSIVTSANGTVTKVAGSYRYQPKVGFYGTDTFTYKVIDSNGGQSIAAATVTIVVNGKPTADAGLPQVLPSIKYFLGAGSLEVTQIVLDGSGSSDPEDNANIDYLWAQVSGPVTVSTIESIVNPTINISTGGTVSGTYIFRLVVTDKNTAPGTLSSIHSDVTITILAPGNLPPIASADASPNPAISGDNITLDASSSGTQPTTGGALTYLWSQSAGPSVISGSTPYTSTAEKPIIVAPTVSSPTDITFELIVNDGINDSSTVDVTITINPVNTPPVAIGNTDKGGAVGMPVTEGEAVTLSGQSSTDNSGISSYVWEQINVGLNDPTILLTADTNPSKMSFPAPTPNASNAPLVLTFRLTVTDDDVNNSLTDSAEVTVYINAIPIADAGIDATWEETKTVTLDGTASSDVEVGQLTYAWTQRSTDVIQLGLGVLTTATPTFTAPPLGSLSTASITFDLVVTDGKSVVSQPDSVTLTITPSSTASCPVAFPGVDREVIESTVVGSVFTPNLITLYGSGMACGSDNAIYGYLWKQVDAMGNDVVGLGAVTLDSMSSWSESFPVFIAPVLPTNAATLDLYFKLVVEDSYGSSSDTNDPNAIVKIRVLREGSTITNQQPVVPVTQTFIIPANGTTQSVYLTGTDPGGDDIALTYRIITGSLTPVVGTLGSVSSYGGSGNVSYSPIFTYNSPVLETKFSYVAIDEYGVESDQGEIIIKPMVSATPNQNPIANDMEIINYGLLTKKIQTITPFDISDPDPNDYLQVYEVSRTENGLIFSIYNDGFNGVQIRVRNGTPPYGNHPYHVPADGTYKYFVVDQFGNTSNMATITADFRENHRPIADDITVNLLELGNVGDPIFSFNLSGSDPDGHSITYYPTVPYINNGGINDPDVSLVVDETTGEVTFSSLKSYGTFTFVYRVRDGYDGVSFLATVNVSYVYGP